MTAKTKTTKRKAGRPTLASMGISPRIRRNFNMERDAQFDRDLEIVQQLLSCNQTDAVKKALEFFVDNYVAPVTPCLHCNDKGYIAIRNGDDDEICECCGQIINTGDIPY